MTSNIVGSPFLETYRLIYDLRCSTAFQDFARCCPQPLRCGSLESKTRNGLSTSSWSLLNQLDLFASTSHEHILDWCLVVLGGGNSVLLEGMSETNGFGSTRNVMKELSMSH